MYKKIILTFSIFFLVLLKLNNSFAMLPEDWFSEIKNDFVYYENLKNILATKNNQTEITKREFLSIIIEASWKSCISNEIDPYIGCITYAKEKWYITMDPTNDDKILVNDALNIISLLLNITSNYTNIYVDPQTGEVKNYKLYDDTSWSIPNRNLNVKDLTRMVFIVWDISKTYAVTSVQNQSINCELDDDWDEVKNCTDVCKTVLWTPINNWCPILEKRCKTDCSCDEWFICSSSITWICLVKWVCLPEKDLPKDDCLYKDYNALLYWNAICNTCPCSNRLSFNSDFRKCDLLFNAITSPDWKEIYGQWNYYQIK